MSEIINILILERMIKMIRLRKSLGMAITLIIILGAFFSATAYAEGIYNTWELTNVTTPAEMEQTSNGVVFGGKIYFFGGGAQLPSLTGSTKAYCFDPVTRTWERKASFTIARRCLATVEAGGKIYLIGGYTNGYSLKDVEMYDPITNTYEIKASLPIAVDYPLVTSIGDKIYVAGGAYKFRINENTQ